MNPYVVWFRTVEQQALIEIDGNPIELARQIGKLEILAQVLFEQGELKDNQGFYSDTVGDLKEALDKLEIEQAVKTFEKELPPPPAAPAPRLIYKQEFTNCGKERCKKCSTGPGHGPYWYSYQFANGRTYKRYVGKELPTDFRPGFDEARSLSNQ